MQIGDLACLEHDKYRFAGIDGALDEPEHAGHELVVACVEQRLVPVASHVARTIPHLPHVLRFIVLTFVVPAPVRETLPNLGVTHAGAFTNEVRPSSRCMNQG